MLYTCMKNCIHVYCQYHMRVCRCYTGMYASVYRSDIKVKEERSYASNFKGWPLVLPL